MSNAERSEYVKVALSAKNPFELTSNRADQNRSLAIVEPADFASGTTKEAQDLLRTVMMAHLVTRHFPKKIETNFEVGSTVFLNELYGHYGFGKPKIVRGEIQITPDFVAAKGKRKEKVLYANAHSGGLDSLYRAAVLTAERKPILLTHLRNLNPTGTLNEAVASRKQAREFGVPYEEVRLRNGTDNTGFAVMRTRDMFLGLVTAMVAEPYGARKVFIEGDMQISPKSHFSEYAPAWEFFNKLLTEVGINSQVEGMDAHDIESIGEVLRLEKELGIDIIPLVQNCFTPKYRIKSIRKRWEREARVISRNSPEHWCGTCAKCRRMTLGRLFYHDGRFSKVPKREIEFFIADTYKWLNDPGNPNNRALASESFMEHLDKLRAQVI